MACPDMPQLLHPFLLAMLLICGILTSAQLLSIGTDPSAGLECQLPRTTTNMFRHFQLCFSLRTRFSMRAPFASNLPRPQWLEDLGVGCKISFPPASNRPRRALQQVLVQIVQALEAILRKISGATGSGHPATP